MGFDTISSDAPWAPEPFPPDGPEPRRRGTRLTALTAAASLVVVAAAAAVAYRAFGGSATDPATLVPASAFAYAQVDLGLAGGQSSALDTLAGRFPDSPTHRGPGDVRDRLLRALFANSDRPHVDYDTEIKPWMGDRAAVAGWLDPAGHPRVEFLVAVRGGRSGQDRVRRLEHKAGDGSAVVFSHGYAVFARSAALAREALAAAKRSSLAGVASFRSDIDALPGPNLAVGWADGPSVHKALSAAVGPQLDQQLARMSLFGIASGQAFAGRVAAALRVTSTYVELDLRTVGRLPAKTAPSTLLTRLPDSTLGAMEVGDPSTVVTGLTAVLKSAFAFAVPHSASVSVPAQPSAALQPQSQAPPPRPSVTPCATASNRCGSTQVFTCTQGACSTPTGAAPEPVRVPVRVSPPSPPPDPLAQIQRYTGLRLPDDARTLLGDGAVVAYGGLGLDRVPKVALRTRPADITRARAVAERLSATLRRRTALAPAVRTAGGDLVVATTGGYADALVAGGSFGRQPQVRAALGDVPPSVTVAGYLDLSSLWAFAGASVPRDLTHLHAVGFWGTSGQGVSRMQVRLVIG